MSLSGYGSGVLEIEDKAVTLRELAYVDVAQKPIYAAYKNVLRDAMRVLDTMPPGEKLEVYFDERDDYHELRDWHNVLGAEYNNRVGPLILLSSVDCVPIQAADFIAYELAKQMNDPKRKRATFDRLFALTHRFSQS